MKIFKFLLLPACVMLAACDEKFARLEFERVEVVRNTETALGLQHEFAETVTKALADLGIGADEVEVIPNYRIAEQVYLNIRTRSFPEAKRAAIKEYLRGIESARAIPLSISWQSVETRSEDWEESFAIGRYGYGEATLSRMTLQAEAPQLNQEPDAALDCYFHSSLTGRFQPYVKSLTINGNRPFLNNEPGNATLTLEDGRFVSETSARLELSHPSLVRLLQKGQVQLRFRSALVQASRLPDGKFIDVHALKHAYITFKAPLSRTNPQSAAEGLSDAKPLQSCERAAMNLGRPLTFHVGVNMDRLQKVTFMDE